MACLFTWGPGMACGSLRLELDLPEIKNPLPFRADEGFVIDFGHCRHSSSEVSCLFAHCERKGETLELTPATPQHHVAVEEHHSLAGRRGYLDDRPISSDDHLCPTDPSCDQVESRAPCVEKAEESAI